MAKIKDHIDTIRARIRQLGDDSMWSSPLLFKMMNDVRAVLIKQQLDKKSSVSTNNEQLICVPLEKDTFYDCSCVPADDCLIMKSTCEIPDVLSYKEKFALRVYDGGRNLIPYVHISKLKGRANLDTNSPYWTLINKRLILFGAHYKVVFVMGIWNDPSEVENFCNCGDSSTDPCIDYSDDDYPIDPHLVSPMEDMVVRTIFPSLNIPDDIRNNANEG